MLIIPVFDTLRVFTLRILRKGSPFAADRNHIHHKIIDLYPNHLAATLILSGINVVFILLAYFGQYLGNYVLFSMLLILAALLNILLTVLRDFSLKKSPVGAK